MVGIRRVPRSRGALSGFLLVLLGLWGGLVAFVGPYFNYAYTPDRAWAWTTGRLWLEVLPAAGTLVGGLTALLSSSRVTAVFGAWLAALSGAWFAVGVPVSSLWTTGGSSGPGTPVGANVTRVLEQVGFFYGLGVVILFLAGLALGRFAVIGIREARVAERDAERAERDRAKAERDHEKAEREREALAAAETTRVARQRTSVDT